MTTAIEHTSTSATSMSPESTPSSSNATARSSGACLRRSSPRSYLDFPRVPNAMAVFGEGFGVTVLDQISWLGDCELVYWGDIDTHGFAILDRLRKRVPAVSSILMDRATLIDHLSHVVVEERPTDAPLAALTDAEAAVHRDLIEDRFGPKVRLEQERIRFAALRGALSPWIGDDEPVRPANMPRIE